MIYRIIVIHPEHMGRKLVRDFGNYREAAKYKQLMVEEGMMTHGLVINTGTIA